MFTVPVAADVHDGMPGIDRFTISLTPFTAAPGTGILLQLLLLLLPLLQSK
jgi:hypothetical protein